MLKRALTCLFAAVALLGSVSLADAQSFPQVNLPPGTFLGRLPGTAGPGEAIPFADLGQVLTYGDQAGPAWVSTLLLGSLGETPFWAVASTAQNYSAGIFATKTSLNTGSPPQSLIGLTTLNYIDNTSQAQVSWSQFGVAIVAANAVYTDGFVIEYSFANYAAAPLVTNPFTTADGYLVAERLDSGTGPASNPISAYIDMVNNGGVADVGIVDRVGSLNMASGKADFLEMPPNHYITWFNADLTPGWTLGATGNTGFGSILLGNNLFDLYLTASNAVHPLSISSTAISLNLPTIIGAGSAITSSGPGGALTAAAYASLGTGVATALGVNVGTAGSLVVNGGAGGTPSSLTLTNAAGLPAASLTGTTLPSGITASSLTGFGAAGSFATSLQTPTLIGGSSVSQALNIESTSGVGTSDAINLKTGSQVTALSIATNQLISLPAVATGTPAASLCIDASNHIIKKTTTGSCV